MDEDSGRTALYRLYNKNYCLLYVGITGDPEARFAQHKASKPWWREVTRKTVEWYGTRDAAALAEIAAIRVKEPWYNREHSRGAVVTVELPEAVHANALDLLCRLFGHDRELVLSSLLMREAAARGLYGDAPCFHVGIGWPEGVVIDNRHYDDGVDTCSCSAPLGAPAKYWYWQERPELGIDPETGLAAGAAGDGPEASVAADSPAVAVPVADVGLPFAAGALGEIAAPGEFPD
jgi:predicted GIY-YIG superfamily endonuclease